ncbi:MAG: 4'-phosphopantetheinyl transferase superfamily protein [Clostridia bacterium]|nr:4'-phosphopantetheinyl transferase superfamily protein [Clostridia bacterium]
MIRLFLTGCTREGEHETGIALAKYAIRTVFGAEPLFARTDRGKPYVTGMDGIFFSIAHSHGLCLAVVSDREIGADIEQNRPGGDRLNRLAARFFTPDEAAYVREDIEPRFYEIWTAKESFIKYTGEGLARPLPSFSVLESELQFTHFRTGEHTICVCSDEKAVLPPLYIDKNKIIEEKTEENS